MASLILEGGSFRCAFTLGVLDAFMENDIYFPYVIGVSAGISNATRYCAKQPYKGMEILRKYRNDPRYSSFGNFWKEHSYFGLKFIYETIPNELVYFDWDTYYNYPGKIVATVTNAETGKAEYLDCKNFDHHNDCYKATCALPGLFPPIEINGKKYFDGGIGSSIPILKAIEDGNNKHIIVLTQPHDYKKELDTKTKLAIKTIEKEYPKLKEAMEKRYLIYNIEKETCYKLEEDGAAIVIEPSYQLNSTESNIEELERAYFDGKAQAYKNMYRIKQFLKEDKK